MAEKYDVRKYITFNSTITRANWLEEKSKWLVSVTTDGVDKIDEADF